MLAQRATGKGSLAYVAAAIIIAAILVSATLVLVSPSSSARTVTRTSTTTATGTYTTTTTETTTQTSISTDYLTLNAAGNASLLADCSSTRVNAPWFGTLVTGVSSPAVLCVQLYEFNSTSQVLVNASSLLSIEGKSASGAGNFTVADSQDQLILGGRSNSNEGTVVAYAITANVGASGTYTLGIRGMELGSEPLGCGSFGELVAGSGQPNYAFIGGCITYSTTSSAQPFTIPRVSYNILSNTLYFRIIALTNSTQ